MRLRADDPRAENVSAVLLDGKSVPMPHQADEEEGWVESYVVTLPDLVAADGDELIEDDETAIAGYQLVRRRGKVEIVFKADV